MPLSCDSGADYAAFRAGKYETEQRPGTILRERILGRQRAGGRRDTWRLQKRDSMGGSEVLVVGGESECGGDGGGLGQEEARALFEEGLAWAREEVARYRWRHVKGGMMPAGYDAEGIAAEAVIEIIQEEESGWDAQERGTSGLARREVAALAVGTGLTVGGADVEGITVSAPEARREKLRRRVREKVRRLSRLKENRSVVSEWEVLGLGGATAGASVFAWMPGSILAPDAALIQKEELALLEQFGKEFAASLAGEEGLGNVFQCIWDGIEKRDEIAAELGLGSAAVAGLRRKLNRRLRGFVTGMEGPAAEVLEHYGILV